MDWEKFTSFYCSVHIHQSVKFMSLFMLLFKKKQNKIVDATITGLNIHWYVSPHHTVYILGPGASFSKNLNSTSDLKQGKDNGYQGDL